jgi:hypothetical protein
MLVACGGSSLPVPDLGGAAGDLSGAVEGGSPLPDLAGGQGDGPSPFQCGSMSCGVGTQCCVQGMTPSCVSSCPDAGFVAECRGPANCGGNACCITLQKWYPQAVTCTTSRTDCAPNVNSKGNGQDRACQVDADCRDGVSSSQLPDCCTNTQTGQKVCFNKAGLFIGGFTCP